MGDGRTLTAKQARFVAEYLVDQNGSAAAVRAGYAASRSKETACGLLKRPHVAAAVRASATRQLDRIEVRADEVLLELLRIARSDVRTAYGPDGAMLPITSMPDDIARAVSSVEHGEYGPKLRLWPKVQALEALAKHLGLLTEKFDLTSGGGPVRFVFNWTGKPPDGR